jgi:hypothetical protein
LRPAFHRIAVDRDAWGERSHLQVIAQIGRKSGHWWPRSLSKPNRRAVAPGSIPCDGVTRCGTTGS